MSDTTKEDCEFVRWFASLDGAEIDIVGGKSGAEEAARFVWTASRQKALQEAAKIAERVVGNRKEDASRNDGRQSDFAFGAVGAADSIASAIRSLGGITSNEGERG